MRLLVLLACGIAALLAGSSGASAGPPWGPATPPFNLQVILHDVAGDNGFGHVKFRQPKDDARVIYLDTWVRDLQPNHAYLLQRQVDLEADGDCADASLSSWLTLGKGRPPLRRPPFAMPSSGGRDLMNHQPPLPKVVPVATDKSAEPGDLPFPGEFLPSSPRPGGKRSRSSFIRRPRLRDHPRDGLQ